MNYPKVSICISNRNGKPLLKRTVEAALKTDYPNKEVIVFDDCSTDGSAEYLEKTFGKRIRLLKPKKWVGFAEGHNICFKKAKGKFIVLLTNDVSLPKHAIIQFLKKLQSDDSIGIVYPTLATPKGRGFGYNHGSMINMLGEGYEADKDNECVLMPVGSVFMMRKNDFIEPYVKEIYSYDDEMTVALRSWLRGFKICRVKNVTVLHQGSYSNKERAIIGKTIYYAERNGIFNVLIFYSPKVIILLSPILLFELTLRIARAALFLNWFQVKNRLKALVWILTNFSQILAVRARLQKELNKTSFKANEKKVIEVMAHGKMKEPRNAPLGKHTKFLLFKMYQNYIKIIAKVI